MSVGATSLLVPNPSMLNYAIEPFIAPARGDVYFALDSSPCFKVCGPPETQVEVA
jgi:hypothetical protein